MPGIESSYMWQGYIPNSENPMMLNPARGFVSSANQLPADKPFILITWAVLFRYIGA